METCRRDIVHWCNWWAWTDDPREIGAQLPYLPFPKQVELLKWIENLEGQSRTHAVSGLVEKTRETGVTVTCCLFALHRWLFNHGDATGFGSRKQEYVDKLGDRKAIFEKIRFSLYRLPKWMMPHGFDRRSHDCFTKLINPEMGSTITGESGDEIGRGDRTTRYFVDEAASLEHPDLVEASLSQTTRCRIDVSTPKGPAGPFYRKRFSGNYSVFTFHWRDDPRKSQEWYEAECQRIGDAAIVAQELDIDYTASQPDTCIPAAWVQASRQLYERWIKEGGMKRLRNIFTQDCVAGFDVAEMGKNLCVFTSRKGPWVFNPISWGNQNTTTSAWRARDEAEKLSVRIVCYDPIGVGAGITGPWQSATGSLDASHFHGMVPFSFVGENVGNPASETMWPDGKTSRLKFFNRKAELWWKLRVRFERTWQYIHDGEEHPVEDLIALPDCPQLVSELSIPRFFRKETGKIQIETKDQLRTRGVSSPDWADSLVLSEAAVDNAWIVGTETKATKGAVASMPSGVWASEIGKNDPYDGERDKGY